VNSPSALLAIFRRVLNRGGHLLIASPYTWLSEFTPPEEWLGARESWSDTTTLQAIQEQLGNEFELISSKELPFLIREHVRKYQWSVAQSSLWKKKAVDLAESIDPARGTAIKCCQCRFVRRSRYAR